METVSVRSSSSRAYMIKTSHDTPGRVQCKAMNLPIAAKLKSIHKKLQLQKVAATKTT